MSRPPFFSLFSVALSVPILIASGRAIEFLQACRMSSRNKLSPGGEGRGGKGCTRCTRCSRRARISSAIRIIASGLVRRHSQRDRASGHFRYREPRSSHEQLRTRKARRYHFPISRRPARVGDAMSVIRRRRLGTKIGGRAGLLLPASDAEKYSISWD